MCDLPDPFGVGTFLPFLILDNCGCSRRRGRHFLNGGSFFVRGFWGHGVTSGGTLGRRPVEGTTNSWMASNWLGDMDVRVGSGTFRSLRKGFGSGHSSGIYGGDDQGCRPTRSDGGRPYTITQARALASVLNKTLGRPTRPVVNAGPPTAPLEAIRVGVQDTRALPAGAQKAVHGPKTGQRRTRGVSPCLAALTSLAMTGKAT